MLQDQACGFKNLLRCDFSHQASFLSESSPKMSNYNHHLFCLGSIGEVTPHGVRKSYHRDGTMDIGSLSTGTEAQVVIIIALTIS